MIRNLVSFHVRTLVMCWKTAHCAQCWPRRPANSPPCMTKKNGRELLSGGAGFRLVDEMEDWMSSWVVGDYARVCDLNEKEAVTVKSAVLTGEVQSVTYELKFRRSLLRLRVSLAGQSSVLRFSADCDFREIGADGLVPQLQLHIPYSYRPQAIRCDVPGGVLDRLELAHDIPVIRYCAPVPESGSALLLTSDCKYGVRAWENALTLDLLRSSTIPDRYPEQGVHQFEIGLGAAPSADSACLRELADCFTHPLYPYSIRCTQVRLVRPAASCRSPAQQSRRSSPQKMRMVSCSDC